MANPRLTVDDFTKQPQALTADDVINQDAKTRLWQSLDYTYGQQRKQSDEQYAKAQAQSWQQALARGMQRSSYASAVAANLGKLGIDANNNIYAAQIADFQNRLGQLEQQEKEDERWERQFAADREDSAWNKQFQTGQFEYQKSRDTVGDQQWEKQFNEGVRQFDLQYALQNAAAAGGSGGGGSYNPGNPVNNVPFEDYDPSYVKSVNATKSTAKAVGNALASALQTQANNTNINKKVNALKKMNLIK